MTGAQARDAARRIVGGYARSAKGLGLAAALLAAALAASAAIVLPLWYLSTRHRALYTWLVGALIAAAFALWVVRRIGRFRALPRRMRARRFTAALSRAALAAGAVVALYIILGLYFARFFGAAVPLSLVYLAVLGYFLYARKPRER